MLQPRDPPRERVCARLHSPASTRQGLYSPGGRRWAACRILANTNSMHIYVHMLSFFALCCLAHCDALRAGMMLCDVPTPALLLDCTTARQRGLTAAALNACLGSGDSGGLSDLVYVHCSVLSGRKPRDGAIGSTTVAGADCPSAAPDASVVLANLDATLEQCGGAGAFLGLGVNNHYTGGYYWGRSSGPGAAMPAPGVRVAVGAAGSVALLRVANSNDGKRSEWCEFLAPEDQCQLVPGNVAAALDRFGPPRQLSSTCFAEASRNPLGTLL